MRVSGASDYIHFVLGQRVSERERERERESCFRRGQVYTVHLPHPRIHTHNAISTWRHAVPIPDWACLCFVLGKSPL